MKAFFLYDKSDLIKETIITASNEKFQFMVQSAISTKKTENDVFEIVNLEEFLKFYIDNDATKNSLSFQLTSINGKLPKLKDKNICHFSLTKIVEKRKR